LDYGDGLEPESPAQRSSRRSADGFKRRVEEPKEWGELMKKLEGSQVSSDAVDSCAC